jgi:hypothetical protein
VPTVNGLLFIEQLLLDLQQGKEVDDADLVIALGFVQDLKYQQRRTYNDQEMKKFKVWDPDE